MNGTDLPAAASRVRRAYRTADLVPGMVAPDVEAVRARRADCGLLHDRVLPRHWPRFTASTS